MAEPSTPYCTAAQLNRFMSSGFSTAAADHNNDGVADDDVINDALMDATIEIWNACCGLYSDAGLAAATIVADWCKMLGAYNLSIHRGNPPPDAWAIEAAEIRKKLERIMAGARLLPSVSQRGDMRPSFSNLRIDRRYPSSTVRVTPNNSTDAPTALTQDDVLEIPAAFD